MTRRICLISLICLLLAVNFSQACLTFYSDYSFAGRKVRKCVNGNLPSYFNDKTSSISVDKGYVAVLYKDHDLSGDSLTFYEGTWNLDSDWNDQVSSVIILKGNYPKFYRDFNAGYTLFTFHGVNETANAPRGHNDVVSSVYVPEGWLAILYTEYKEQGKSHALLPGLWNAPPEWNDQLSSAVTVKNCLILFSDYNQQGDHYVLCKSGNVPAEWNDRVSSIAVPTGLKVTLFSDYNYGGNTLDIQEGFWQAEGGWNDVLSSLQING